MLVDDYIEQFTNLRTDRNRKTWSADTCHRAPHKPFLLPSMMGLIAQGKIAYLLTTFHLADT